MLFSHVLIHIFSALGKSVVCWFSLPTVKMYLQISSVKWSLNDFKIKKDGKGLPFSESSWVSFVIISYTMTRNPTVGLRYVTMREGGNVKWVSAWGLEQEKDSNCLYKQAQGVGQDHMKGFEGNHLLPQQVFNHGKFVRN